ncbi:hypothetical protein OH491_25895 [Termitidicoccus mucosus]|uniref:hypothetical protein n=1 Tax=Termitidicoccus mucosus TaxID=1184151 RepID=UPI000A018DCD
MAFVLKKFLFRFLARLGAGVLLAAALLAGRAWWLAAHDPLPVETRRAAVLDGLAQQRAAQEQTLAAAEARLEALQSESIARQVELHQAARTVEGLHERKGGWFGWLGKREGHEALVQRLASAETARANAAERIAGIDAELPDALQAWKDAEAGIVAVDKQARRVSRAKSGPGFYALQAWNDWRRAALAVIVLVLVGPWFRLVILYYGFAPFVTRRHPARLTDEEGEMPFAGETGTEVRVQLWPGERLLVRRGFVADEGAEVTAGLAQGRRALLSWRFPLSSLMCGMARLVELRNTHAGAPRRVPLRGVIGMGAGGGGELTIIHVAEGASLVMRPRWLAGVVGRADEPVQIRGHWRAPGLRACVSGQFRHLEFTGPCRLVVASRRGVKVEQMETDGESGREPARRANWGEAIAFSPGLRFRPARAESFWSYCRGMSLLFDELFMGTGVVLLTKRVPGSDRSAGWPGRFLANRWRGFQKLFGL